MTDNPLLLAALQYSAMGWHVFPCRPGMKVPATPHGVKEATTSEATIRAWWTRWPAANVALACGAASGVYVIDVDVDPAKGIDGFASLEAFPELPTTIRQSSPRGGAHFIFKASTPVRNKNSFRPGIDIRGEGYYIIVAPSIHPNGKAYAWAKDLGPEEVELAEYPDFMRPPVEKPAAAPWDRPAVAPEPAKKAPDSPGSTPILERAALYLSTCEPAMQGQAGHDKLLWAARAMVVGFELDHATALGLLWSEFNPRCIPPWDRSKPSEAKDFERKVVEARRTPGQKPRGWLLDELGLRGQAEAALEYGKTLAAGLLACKKATTKPDKVLIKKQTPIKSKTDFPDWILHPPGLVGQFCGWINETAGCPQPALALAASLTACGALFGRKVRDQSNGRTNLYMMGVAHSSAGKDHPADCIEQLFALAGASGLLGGSRVTSDTAIELALSANPVQLFNWDEVGHMFAAIKQAGVGSGNGQHLRTIVPALMQLYSSAHKLFVGKQKAEEELRRIDQPHVCVWGLTSPDVLYQSLSTAELRDGWLGRVITVISHDRPKYQIKRAMPPPEGLVSMVQAWLTRVIPPPDDVGNIRAATGCYQKEIPTDAAAMKVFEDFRDECYERMLKCDSAGDDAQYLWGKALQNARRIALIVAVGDQFDGAEIGEFHAKYGCELIRLCTLRFSECIKHNLADNQFEADKQKIMRIISATGSEGISKCELTKRTPSFKNRETRNSYIADLAEARMIVVGMNEKRPDAKAGWLWKYPYGLTSGEQE